MSASNTIADARTSARYMSMMMVIWFLGCSPQQCRYMVPITSKYRKSLGDTQNRSIPLIALSCIVTNYSSSERKRPYLAFQLRILSSEYSSATGQARASCHERRARAGRTLSAGRVCLLVLTGAANSARRTEMCRCH